MLKRIVAAVLIVVTAGAWIYLDYLNKQEQLAAEQSRKEMEAMRAKAQALAEARAKFEAQLNADLEACKVSADAASKEYIAKNQQPVKRKPGEFTVPQAVADEAARMLDEAVTACQATHDSRLAAGN